jgi:predicted nuclease with TOPRIM domain
MNQQPEKKSGNRTFAVLSILFAALSAFLGFQLYTLKNTNDAQVIEMDKVKSDFDATKAELAEVQKAFEGLNTNNKQLQSELDAKREELQDLSAQLEKAKGNESLVAKLRKEIKSLKDSLQRYVAQIDSLNVVNQQLKEENTVVKTDLAAEKGKTDQLSQEKKALSEKVALGQKLKIFELFADGVKVKGEKESSTTKARRVDKIRACFIIGENRIAKQENITLYMKITGPDGQVLVTSRDDSNMFSIGGERQYFSAKKTVAYANETMDMCLYFTRKESDKLKDGKYKVDVFIESDQVGSSSFELR